MEYFSVRNGIKIVLPNEFHERFAAMMNDFASRGYFKEKLEIYGISANSQYINNKSKGHIGIEIYPFNQWKNENKKSNLVFDAIEFLYRFVSKPGEWGTVTNHTGWNSEDFLSYNDAEGKLEFKDETNILLNAFDQGYELQSDGNILFIGDETVNFIDTDFPEYNKENIDSAIHLALKWWKNRNQTLDDKKKAILKLAGILEYLKKDGTLLQILEKQDSSDLFNIANNFGIRHHNPDQKTEYDKNIWYDWIFQYYLNTCIGVLKMIKKNKP